MTGCYAQRAPEEIALIPGVRVVAGNGEKARIPELIGEMAAGEPRVLFGDIRKEVSISLSGATVFPGHTSALLKIQDGCDAF